MGAGVSGSSLCQKIGKSRSWLTGLERGYTNSTEEDRALVADAIEGIVRARQYVAAAAAKAGVSLIGVVTAPDAFTPASMVASEAGSSFRAPCRNSRRGSAA